jgi:hypothetical protein
MKITRERLVEIIKEELDYSKRLAEDELGTLSNIEIEEMLRNYFKRQHFPANIQRLSVFLDILDRAGLQKLSDSYKNFRQAGNDYEAQSVLEPARRAVAKIKSEQ